MILWLVFGAVAAVWGVFRSPALDVRFVAAGALLPLVVDAPVGSQSYGHSLLASTVLLVAVMAVTAGRGNRLRRRRWLGLPIGSFTALVLAGAWRHDDVFWWPAFGIERPEAPLLWSWPVVVALEIAGLAIAVTLVRRFGLARPDRRRALLRAGRLTPEVR